MQDELIYYEYGSRKFFRGSFEIILKYMNRTIFSILFLFLSNTVAQQSYFGKNLSPLLLEKKDFWKKIYAEIDSSKTVIYDKNTLRIYSVTKNENLSTALDSIRKTSRYPNRIMIKQGRKEFVQNAISRATKYIFISDSLASHKLHPDLRWLPVLESGYLDTMISDQDARGIWQFIPSTAKIYGLLPEEITDPQKSTSAFVQYMSFLYKQFGDYALALTAYHHGEGGIADKLKKAGGSSLNDIIPQLGFQSGNYFARFLAIVDIAHAITGNNTSLDTINSPLR
jgi:hypothetical protein